MAIMTSEAEIELGGYWLHTTLAQGAASGMFQGDGTTRKKKTFSSSWKLPSLAGKWKHCSHRKQHTRKFGRNRAKESFGKRLVPKDASGGTF